MRAWMFYVIMKNGPNIFTRNVNRVSTKQASTTNKQAEKTFCKYNFFPAMLSAALLKISYLLE